MTNTQMSGNSFRQLLESDYKYTDIVLQYILDIKRSQIFLDLERTLKKEEYDKFLDIQKKIKEGMPLQYAIGKWNFYGRDFEINKNVLIPRPETEILVEVLLKENLGNKKILDIGTGSGIIAITLKAESKENIDVVASDISNKALEIAKINASKIGVNIKFIESDLFENIENKFDIIVSNPPYLSSDEYLNVDKLLYHEPKNALVAGRKGFEIYQKIIEESENYLNNNGKIFFEIGYTQANIVAGLLKKYKFKNIKIIKDYSGHDRVVIGELCLNN